MIKYLNKKYPNDNYPSILIHLYYLMISFTLCYVYYHKFITRADFFSPASSGGIYAVLNGEALKPVQFRILVPLIFKAAQTVISLVKVIPDKALFFLITIMLCYMILFSFYLLLGQYFKGNAMNCWLASIIIYPMIWNLVIMNGQFFYMDFSILLIIILGFYCIVAEKYNWLLLVFFLGVLNHPSVGYLIIAFLIYNYRNLFKVKTIGYAAAMSILYIGIYRLMDSYFPSTEGYFVIYNLPRNLNLLHLLPLHIILRDIFFNFGGLHLFVIIFLISGAWKRYRGPLLYVNLVIIPYVISVLVNFSIEEIRNYVTIIPFVLILTLLFLSSFENSFLKPVDRLFDIKKKPKPFPVNKPARILYISSNGGIHDYRFLKKIVNDYEVLFLHYAAGEIIEEIDKLKNLEIISKKPAFRSMPYISEQGHLKKIIDEFKPDIIHSGYVWQVGILAAESGFHPHLAMPWGSDILTEPDKSFIRKRMVNRVMKTCDHVQCDAEFVKKKIVDDYGLDPESITVFPWGIDLSIFRKHDKSESRTRLNLKKSDFIILFNRYFEPVYGVQYLLEAFKKFSAGKDNVQLLMLSEGSGKNEAIKYITESGLEEKVSLIGRVPNAELPVFLNAADIYISPSLSDGTSLSLLEAMACGLGLVVSDVPAIKEWVDDKNGIVVPKSSSIELAAAMEKYYNNPELIHTHSAINIQIAAERADWDKNYLKLKEIYNNLLNEYYLPQNLPDVITVKQQ